MKTLNLNALQTQHHTVVNNGMPHKLRPITARVANLIASAEEAEGLAKMTAYYDAVALLLPSMPRGEVDDLTPGQLAEIIGLASTEVDAVNEAAAVEPVADPLAEGPAPETTPGASAAT